MNLSITVSSPVWYSARSTLTDSLAQAAGSYGQNVTALGGYWDAELACVLPVDEALHLWRYAIGYDATVRNHAGVVIFEGFIDVVEVSVGSLKITRGPMLDVVNYGFMRHQTVRYNTNPPIGGSPRTTAVVQDATSITRYGHLAQIISGGEMPEAVADDIVARYIADKAVLPGGIPGVDLNSGEQQSGLSVRLMIKGYVHLFDRYFYSNTGTGTVTRSAKIQAVATADPSSRFSSDYTAVDTNSDTIHANEIKDRTAWEVIKEVVSAGDSSNNRWTFQVLAGRKIHYKQADTAVTYRYNPREPGQGIKIGEVDVYRWDVKAGKWLVVEGILAQTGTTDPNDDQRAMYIEQVKYGTPWDLGIDGGSTPRLTQLLARYGLGSI